MVAGPIISGAAGALAGGAGAGAAGATAGASAVAGAGATSGAASVAGKVGNELVPKKIPIKSPGVKTGSNLNKIAKGKTNTKDIASNIKTNKKTKKSFKDANKQKFEDNKKRQKNQSQKEREEKKNKDINTDTNEEENDELENQDTENIEKTEEELQKETEEKEAEEAHEKETKTFKLMMTLAMIKDSIEIIFGLIPGPDLIVNVLTFPFTLALVTILLLSNKKSMFNSVMYYLGQLADSMPILSVAPISTLAVFLTFKVEKIAESSPAVQSVLKNKGKDLAGNISNPVNPLKPPDNKTPVKGVLPQTPGQTLNTPFEKLNTWNKNKVETENEPNDKEKTKNIENNENSEDKYEYLKQQINEIPDYSWEETEKEKETVFNNKN